MAPRGSWLAPGCEAERLEPLVLLVHPQQPLSYPERLVQPELPTIKDGDKEKILNKEQTGKLNRKSPDEAAALRGGHGEGRVESYSGLGHEAPTDKNEQRKFDILLAQRLRNTSKKISAMADIKRECGQLAHEGAQRVAMAGFGVLCGWWYLVYRLTFETDRYLMGLSTLIVSYRSAMNFTISKRQSKLCAARGFDLRKWQGLIEEGNTLRRDIKAVANEYDVERDELGRKRREGLTCTEKGERKEKEWR
ncbi:uncharacterized protein K441DRAFT_702331 [Cenococcum geophilum 1.58]|uniref:uncharacterized protein n=1 Tax=Cenococcum geophilum 1.58 TaxID=794803 RepID=UPI00358FB973|nr:hypothetical protein K441DRAFT_702331 [Cenococcum geophilum 1.58]